VVVVVDGGLILSVVAYTLLQFGALGTLVYHLVVDVALLRPHVGHYLLVIILIVFFLFHRLLHLHCLYLFLLARHSILYVHFESQDYVFRRLTNVQNLHIFVADKGQRLRLFEVLVVEHLLQVRDLLNDIKGVLTYIVAVIRIYLNHVFNGGVKAWSVPIVNACDLLEFLSGLVVLTQHLDIARLRNPFNPSELLHLGERIGIQQLNPIPRVNKKVLRLLLDIVCVMLNFCLLGHDASAVPDLLKDVRRLSREELVLAFIPVFVVDGDLDGDEHVGEQERDLLFVVLMQANILASNDVVRKLDLPVEVRVS